MKYLSDLADSLSDQIDALKFEASHDHPMSTPESDASFRAQAAALERTLTCVKALIAEVNKDADISAEQLRLHLGELTAEEVRVAKAAFRYGFFCGNTNKDFSRG